MESASSSVPVQPVDVDMQVGGGPGDDWAGAPGLGSVRAGAAVSTTLQALKVCVSRRHSSPRPTHTSFPVKHLRIAIPLSPPPINRPPPSPTSHPPITFEVTRPRSPPPSRMFQRSHRPTPASLRRSSRCTNRSPRSPAWCGACFATAPSPPPPSTPTNAPPSSPSSGLDFHIVSLLPCV